MKNPTELLGSLYSNSSSLTNDAPGKSERQSPAPRALRVWTRLSEIYGDRFLREFGAELIDYTGRRVADVSTEAGGDDE